MALTLDTLRGQHLATVPRFQKLVGHVLLRPSYRIPRRTEIVLEGVENIPRDRTVFFAMNHTDRYNYWPFQFAMWRRGGLPFTATWVKGKYFENRWMARFMNAANNIPLPSRGYVIATEFRRVIGRPPDSAEYREMRDLTEGARTEASSETVKRFLAAVPLATFEEYFQKMNGEVIRLNREALNELNLNVLVFPQGTRSKRLLKGHIGLMEMAQHFGKEIVPVGCNGSDRAYPGGSPWSSGGRIVYRIGAPLSLDGPELGAFRVREPFTPLTRDAATRFEGKFQAATDVVMTKIEALLDEEYRAAPDAPSDSAKGVERFL